MKIFIFNGSYQGKKSLGEYFSNQLSSAFKGEFENSEISYYSLKNSYIQNCRGCSRCFYYHECLLNDDMSKLKNDMLSSDLIILISPVFVHDVSGGMKNFIDRIGYWTHLMKLSGRTCITVSVSSNNGNQFVNDYLRKVSEFLGLSILFDIEIQGVYANPLIIDTYVKECVRRVRKAYRNESFPITDNQEKIFKFNQQKYSKDVKESIEHQYWKKNNMLEFETFKEYYDYCFKCKN